MELTIDRLSKQFGSKIAVDRVSATLEPGVYGLLGANGAGKTTLMRMVCDVLRPTSGEIRFDGRDVRALGDEMCIRDSFSSEATPLMVVPPGEHTASFMAPGLSLIHICTPHSAKSGRGEDASSRPVTAAVARVAAPTITVNSAASTSSLTALALAPGVLNTTTPFLSLIHISN